MLLFVATHAALENEVKNMSISAFVSNKRSLTNTYMYLDTHTTHAYRKSSGEKTGKEQKNVTFMSQSRNPGGFRSTFYHQQKKQEKFITFLNRHLLGTWVDMKFEQLCTLPGLEGVQLKIFTIPSTVTHSWIPQRERVAEKRPLDYKLLKNRAWITAQTQSFSLQERSCA